MPASTEPPTTSELVAHLFPDFNAHCRALDRALGRAHRFTHCLAHCRSHRGADPFPHRRPVVCAHESTVRCTYALPDGRAIVCAHQVTVCCPDPLPYRSAIGSECATPATAALQLPPAQPASVELHRHVGQAGPNLYASML
jgi:hypothetical protein